MEYTRVKKILLGAVLIAFFCCFFCASFVGVSAAETEPPAQVTDDAENTAENNDNEATNPPETDSEGETEQTTTETPTEEPTNEADEPFDMAALVEKFTAYLKDKYGAEYEQIYNGIIEQWGSIEAYLLQFGEEYIPKEYNAGWTAFVTWLRENAPIWATPLALACVIFIAVFGKKAFTAIVQKIVDSKVNALATELNKQSAALAAQMKALKMIMPTTEKCAAAVQELDEKEKELSKE